MPNDKTLPIIIDQLAQQTGLPLTKVKAAITLLDEGNTVPFIARYRQDATGGITDDQLRLLTRERARLTNLHEKRADIIRLLEEQGNLTADLQKDLDHATTTTELEDIYRPYRPRRRTKASIAREQGLAPLADILAGRPGAATAAAIRSWLSSFKRPNTDGDEAPLTDDECLTGACYILAEELSDAPEVRKALKAVLTRDSQLCATTSTNEDAAEKYKTYTNFAVVPSRLKSYQILAINRGEREDALRVSFSIDEDQCHQILEKKAIQTQIWQPASDSLVNGLRSRIAADAWKRLLAPSLENEVRNALTEEAEQDALDIFSRNLRAMLLAPPLRDRVVLAFDPGYRNGCKLAVTDPRGDVLATAHIYPVKPREDLAGSMKTVDALVARYGVQVLALGNGTATRETEAFIDAWQRDRSDRPSAHGLKTHPDRLPLIVVNEAGASVYSASEVGATEFPNMAVELRSAVSLARRLQDPLAELVKIEPGSIGVGQYQHDINARLLSSRLGEVVEDCVNAVGADLNAASPSLLAHIAGINRGVAANICSYRAEKGGFTSRRELLKVPKLGPKAFEQCAGFLRVRNPKEPLDNTSVHPESYKATYALLERLIQDAKERKAALVSLSQGRGIDLVPRAKVIGSAVLAKELGIGPATLSDILNELKKAGRDGRKDMEIPDRTEGISDISDLKTGMILKGTVRNVVQFGAFVDIGVHQDGLVHISEMADRFIKDPHEVCRTGEVIQVKVIEVDQKKGKIELSIKQARS